jgi:hypothetical protein
MTNPLKRDILGKGFDAAIAAAGTAVKIMTCTPVTNTVVSLGADNKVKAITVTITCAK